MLLFIEWLFSLEQHQETTQTFNGNINIFFCFQVTIPLRFFLVTPFVTSGNSNVLLQKWELLVLSKLKWDMAAITPHDFLKHLLNRIPMEEEWNISYDMVLNHAKTLITLCARGKWTSFLKPISFVEVEIYVCNLIL